MGSCLNFHDSNIIRFVFVVFTHIPLFYLSNSCMMVTSLKSMCSYTHGKKHCNTILKINLKNKHFYYSYNNNKLHILFTTYLYSKSIKFHSISSINAHAISAPTNNKKISFYAHCLQNSFELIVLNFVIVSKLNGSPATHKCNSMACCCIECIRYVTYSTWNSSRNCLTDW